MGRDVVLLVSGGTAHIGAVATACLAADRTVTIDTLTLPGHREGELAAELAMTASLSLGRTIAVLVGIHLDRPSKQQIEDVVADARSALNLFLSRWQEEPEDRA
jgi:hypothetical protein